LGFREIRGLDGHNLALQRGDRKEIDGCRIILVIIELRIILNYININTIRRHCNVYRHVTDGALQIVVSLIIS